MYVFSAHTAIVIRRSLSNYKCHINPKYQHFWFLERIRMYIYRWAELRRKNILCIDQVSRHMLMIEAVPATEMI